MVPKSNPEVERARSASAEEIPALAYASSEDVLIALLENPRRGESHLRLLLERKDLPGTVLEAIARRKEWLRSYRVKRQLAFHMHAPRLLVMRLARELFLMDLVQLSLLPSVAVEIRRLAEELIIARLPQLPLGQKLTLARRGPARVAGSLLAEGHEQVVRVALDNALLTEAQVLKVLSREHLPAPVVPGIARHRKWSQVYNVRVALIRHPMAPLARLLSFLPDLALRDLEDLCDHKAVSASLRRYIRHEIARRSAAGERASRRNAAAGMAPRARE